MISNPKKKTFFSAVTEDILLLISNNKAPIVFAILIPTLFSPLAATWRTYRLKLDQQILYKDPDLTIIEGENIKSSNANFWFTNRNKCFNNKFMALYTRETPKIGYYFFKYTFTVKKSGEYNIFLTGAPAGTKTSGLDTYFCPFQVLLDNNKVNDFDEESNKAALFLETGSIFYTDYEYAQSMRITKLGKFNLKQGEHELEFRISQRPINDQDYKFYADAIFIVPVGWIAKSSTFSLAEDFLTH